MTDFLPPVDVETLTVDYLKTVAAVTSLVGVDGVSGDLPRAWNPGERHVRVTRVGGLPTDRAAYLDQARIQIDAFGATDIDAHTVAAATLLALLRLPTAGYSHPGAVVNAVRQDLGLANLPDPDSDAPRYLFGMVLTVHPTSP